MNSLKLFIVDDEKIILEGLTRTFDWKSAGFRVVGTALSGEEALPLIDRLRPDLVMTDIRMKKMDGLQLMEETARIDPSIRFVVLSAYKDFEYARRAIERGALSYIVKPVNDDMLITMKKVHDTCIRDIEKDATLEAWRDLLLENRQSFLNYMTGRFLEGSQSAEEFRDNMGNLMDEDADGHYFAVITVDCDVIYRISDFEEFDMKRFALFSYMEKEISKSFSIYPYHNKDGSESIIVDMGDAEHTYKLRLIASEARKALGFDIISAISGAYTGFEGMRKAYYQSTSMYSLACEIDEDISEEYEVGRESRYPYEAEKNVLSALRKNDKEAIKDALLAFVGALGDDDKANKIFIHQLIVHAELVIEESYGMDGDVRQRFEEIYSTLFSYSASRMIHLSYDLFLFVIDKRKASLLGVDDSANDYIRKALSYIEGHIEDDELSIGDVADAVHLNPVYFGRIFKAMTGVSFKQYVLGAKIELAKKLLLMTDDSVTQIGKNVGIDNSSYFTRLFRQLVGVTPSEFRKNA